MEYTTPRSPVKNLSANTESMFCATGQQAELEVRVDADVAQNAKDGRYSGDLFVTVTVE